jgi:predicted PolB exonuclease-like 3'-5' exonuclease
MRRLTTGQADGLSRQARHGWRQGLGGLAGGRIAEIRDYCETDVVNTYLVYNRRRVLLFVAARSVSCQRSFRHDFNDEITGGEDAKLLASRADPSTS